MRVGLVAIVLLGLMLAGCTASSNPPPVEPLEPVPAPPGQPAAGTPPAGPAAPPASPSPGPSTPRQPGTSPEQPPAPPADDQPPPGEYGPPRQWPAPDQATIRPGVQMTVDGGQCTSNFVYTDRANATVYLGFAAHCVTAVDPNEALDGCDPVSKPFEPGKAIEVEGANTPATLVYSSWYVMQKNNETNANACQYNDFAVVALSAADAALTNPAMLQFGGPTGTVATSDIANFDKVITYGNSGLRLGIAALSPHEGYVLFPDNGGGWSTQVQTVTPGIPGDSGSGAMMGDGRALGVVVTISYAGASNGITNLEKAMAYANEHAGLELQLATWEQLDAGVLPPV